MFISEHFNRSEFACQCGCCFDTVDVELLRVLEKVRHHFMRPVIVTSGCRCQNHNKKIGGSENSQHLYGRAADIKVKDVKPEDVYVFLDKHAPNNLGLGLYNSWVHVDTRNGKARW
jgi:uncharacterized protein YcbK (DUF882 family)